MDDAKRVVKFDLRRSDAGGFVAFVTTLQGKESETRLISYANAAEAIADFTKTIED